MFVGEDVRADRVCQILRGRGCWIAGAAALLIGGAAGAADFKWRGNGGIEANPLSGMWNTAGDWVDGNVPANNAATRLLFQSGTNNYTAANNIPGGPLTLNTLKFSKGNSETGDITLNGNSIRMFANGATKPTIESSTGAFVYIDLSIAVQDGRELNVGGTSDGFISIGTDSSDGVISGTGASVKLNGGGYYRLRGKESNTYTGTTHIEFGTLEPGKVAGKNAIPGNLIVGQDMGTNAGLAIWGRSNQMPDNAKITILKTGRVNIFGESETIGTLTGLNPATSLQVSAIGKGDLTLAGTGAMNEQSAFGGKLQASSTDLDNDNKALLTVKGANHTFVYTGDGSEYKGTVVADGGHFNITGWIGRNPNMPDDGTACKQAVAKNGGTISGSGWLLCKKTDGKGVLIENNGKLKPKKNSPGVMYMDEVFFDPGGILDIEMDPVGLDTSWIDVQGGGVVLSGAMLTLTLDSPPPTWGATYPIVMNRGVMSVVGQFDGLPEGAPVTAYYGGTPYDFYISYMGGDGNDVVLYHPPVPEPGTLLLGALAAGWFTRRRRG